MALSYVQYSGDGSTRNFAIPFPYISTNDVKVAINGTSQTGFNFLSGGGTIQLPTVPAAGSTVEVRRVTPRDTRLVDFNDGSVITESDLDLANIQVFYIVQEAVDAAGGTLGIDTDGSFNALGRRITNVADPVGPKNAVNLQYVQGTLQPQLQALVTSATSARDAAITARDAAAASASSAAQSKSDMAASLALAQTARNDAQTARTDAQTARDEASGSATAAASSKTDAAASATNAASSASTATSKATAAASSATDAANSANSIGTAKTDAQAARDGAVTAKDGAITARTEAQTARDLANAYANAGEDALVAPGQYSAYHWSIKAKAFASGSASAISFTPTGSLSSTNVQAALGELDTKKAAVSHVHTLAQITGLLPLLQDGAVRLRYASATAVRLDPVDGGVLFIGDTPQLVPQAGVSGGLSGLSTNVLYYVYAYMNGSTMALAFSTTGHVADTYGRRVLSGNASYRLVGMVRTNGSNQFSDVPENRGVLSYFNRRSIQGYAAHNNGTTAGTSPSEYVATRIVFLCWSDEVSTQSVIGNGSNSTAGAFLRTRCWIDGTTAAASGATAAHPTAGGVVMLGATMVHALTEGYHYCSVAYSVTGGTGTFSTDNLLSIEG